MPYCRHCGTELRTAYLANCPNCGEPPSEMLQPAAVVALPQKDPALTIVIAMVAGFLGLLGMGHIYVGKIARGILLLIGGFAMIISLYAGLVSFSVFETEPLEFATGMIIAVVIAGLGYLALFVWQIFDSHKLAKQFNESARAANKEPW